MEDIHYRYLDLLSTGAIGVLVAIIAAFYIFLTLECIRGASAADQSQG